MFSTYDSNQLEHRLIAFKFHFHGDRLTEELSYVSPLDSIPFEYFVCDFHKATIYMTKPQNVYKLRFGITDEALLILRVMLQNDCYRLAHLQAMERNTL